MSYFTYLSNVSKFQVYGGKKNLSRKKENAKNPTKEIVKILALLPNDDTYLFRWRVYDNLSSDLFITKV